MHLKNLAVFLVFCATAAAQPYDLIIRNGHVIDGTGSPWYSGDIAIQQGRIAAIGQLSAASAKHSIDAHGMVVAPGFIDMLGQSELTILVNPHLPSKIYQGITTEITGEGRFRGAAERSDEARADGPATIIWDCKPDWSTFRQYFARLEKQGIGINLASYVGATTVRRVVIWAMTIARPPPANCDRMKQLVREAMRDGAMGLSTSLQYAPAPYASTEELIALAVGERQAGRHLCDAHAQRRRRDQCRRSMK